MKELVIAFLSDFITFPSGSYSLKILAWKITLWLIDWLIDWLIGFLFQRWKDSLIERLIAINRSVDSCLIDWLIRFDGSLTLCVPVFVCFSWSMKLCQREAQERKLLAKYSWNKNCLRTSNASGSNLFNCEEIKCLARDIWKHCTL